MKSGYSLLLASLVALSSSSALAKGRVDGIYTGVMFDDEIDRATETVPPVTVPLGKNNAIGGTLVAGFGFEVNNWVLALEADATLHSGKEVWSNESWWGPTLTSVGLVPGDYTASTKFRRSFGFLARYGYTFDDVVFLYGSVGWVQSWLGTRVTDISDPAAPVAIKFKDHISGIRYGGGVEGPGTKDLSIRGDYLHTNYKNYLYEISDGTNFYDVSVNPSADTFRLGLAFHW